MVQRMRELKIYAARLWDGDCARQIPLLDRDRQARLAAVRHDGEYRRSISAGLLLRHAFLQSGYREEQWRRAEILYGAHGKPCIKGADGFAYSISHSAEWVICAASQTPVGADIQQRRPWRMQMARRFFADVEYDRLVSLETDAARTECFYRMWTAKESCVKLTGLGLGSGVSRCVTDADFGHIRTDRDTPLPIRIYDAIAGYTVCVCSREAPFPEELIFVNLHEA